MLRIIADSTCDISKEDARKMENSHLDEARAEGRAEGISEGISQGKNERNIEPNLARYY